MTHQETSNERVLFERYAERRGIPLDRLRDGGYRAFQAKDAWDAWLARAQIAAAEKTSPPE